MTSRAREILKPIAIVPSILATDIEHLADEVRAVDAADADWIRRRRQLCETDGRDPFIEVGDGENYQTTGQAIEEGANAIVAGSVIFGSVDYAAAITAIRNTARPLATRALL